jgi:hypothetical protein
MTEFFRKQNRHCIKAHGDALALRARHDWRVAVHRSELTDWIVSKGLCRQRRSSGGKMI